MTRIGSITTYRIFARHLFGLAADFGFGVWLGEVGVAFLDHGVFVTVAKLAGHGYIIGRCGAVGFHRSFFNVAVGVFRGGQFSHGIHCMRAGAVQLPYESKSG
jgi:hypothetical protein